MVAALQTQQFLPLFFGHTWPVKLAPEVQDDNFLRYAIAAAVDQDFIDLHSRLWRDDGFKRLHDFDVAIVPLPALGYFNWRGVTLGNAEFGMLEDVNAGIIRRKL